MKEDKVVFADKIGAIEYITKHSDFGRIEVKVVTKQQVEKEELGKHFSFAYRPGLHVHLRRSEDAA